MENKHIFKLIEHHEKLQLGIFSEKTHNVIRMLMFPIFGGKLLTIDALFKILCCHSNPLNRDTFATQNESHKLKIAHL